MKSIIINFGNLLEEMKNKQIKLCLLDEYIGWFLIDSQNKLYQIEDYYRGGFLDSFIIKKALIEFEPVPEAISNNIKDWEKDIWDFDDVKDFIIRLALI